MNSSCLLKLFKLLGIASCVIGLALLTAGKSDLLAQDSAGGVVAPAKSISKLRAQRDAELATQSMDPKVKEAWDRYISAPEGQHNPEDLLRLQANWDQVQAAAHRGEIPAEQNSRFLRDHGKDMQARLKRAGAAENLDVSLQAPSGQQKTYSDTDGHLRPKAGEEMTPEQIQNVRQRFNEEFNRDLHVLGEPELKNPSATMRTDGMPVTDDPKLFERAKQIINSDGGMMYDSHDAVNQEIANRTGGSGETTLKEKVAHAQEQVRQMRSHHQEAAHKIEEGRALINNNPPDSPEHRRGLRLLEEAHGEGASAGGKYEKRLNKGTEAIAEQTGGAPPETGGKRAAAVEAVNERRDFTVNKESSTLNSSYENEIFDKQRTNVKNLASSGHLPEAAEMARNATPNQRGQLLEDAREAIFEREAASLRAAGLGLDEAKIQTIARQRADQQTARLAEEMRKNSTPDRWNAAEHQWELNSTYGKTDATGSRAARLGGAAEAEEALSGLGKGRPSWDTGPSDVAVINPDAKVKPIDGRAPEAGPDYLGAAAAGVEIGGQLLERGSRQMGEAIDENRDLNAGDAAEVAEDMLPGVAGYKGMQQELKDRQVERLERQERIRQLRDKENRTLEEVKELIRLEHAEKDNPDTALGNATAMAKEGIAGRFKEMEERAKKEGRERPEFFKDGVPMFGEMAKDAVNALNPINQMGAPIAEGEAEASTFDERADWAAQKAAMVQYVNQKATWADKRTRDMVTELDRILLQEDAGNPANRRRVDVLLSGIRANQEEINKLVALADKQLGEVEAEKLATLRGIARSQPDLNALSDYARQMQGRSKNPADKGAPDSWEAGASDKVKDLEHGPSAEGQGWGASGNEVVELTPEKAQEPALADWEREVREKAERAKRRAYSRGDSGGEIIYEPRREGGSQGGDPSGVTDFITNLMKGQQRAGGGSATTGRPRCTGDAARDAVLGQISGGGCEGQAGTWGGATGSTSGSAFRSPKGAYGATGGQIPGFSTRGATPEAPRTPPAPSNRGGVPAGFTRPRSSGGPGTGEFPVDRGRGILRR